MTSDTDRIFFFLFSFPSSDSSRDSLSRHFPYNLLQNGFSTFFFLHIDREKQEIYEKLLRKSHSLLSEMDGGLK